MRHDKLSHGLRQENAGDTRSAVSEKSRTDHIRQSAHVSRANARVRPLRCDASKAAFWTIEISDGREIS